MNNDKLHKFNKLKNKIDELDKILTYITNEKIGLEFKRKRINFLSYCWRNGTRQKEIKLNGELRDSIFKLIAIQHNEYKQAFESDNADIGEYNLYQHVLNKEQLEEYKMLKKMFDKEK